MNAKAPRNKTIELSEQEIEKFRKVLVDEHEIINGDIFNSIEKIQEQSIDLLIVDPPYNLTKNYNGLTFKSTSDEEYQKWTESWICLIKSKIKQTGSIYVCCDWKTSPIIHQVLSNHFIVRNRITWEREKGRGSKTNWKNNIEDIYFATVSDEYTFNIDAVKLKKSVIAQYRNQDGVPKDWEDTDEGKFRLTHPSNVWTDISIPFWSMPENTDHPTQKPEKLIAKLILASSNEGDFVFDPFLGSGTTAVVAKKLNRKYGGVEINETYLLLCLKRLEQADTNKRIQGYENGIFYERNSMQK